MSQGNTPDKVESTPASPPAAGPESPVTAPSTAPTTPAPDVAAKVTPTPAATAPAPSGGQLGDSLRNLKQYFSSQSFDNQRGAGEALGDRDIQFDSKGADFGPWIRRFVAQVKSNWDIPLASMIFSGHVVIQFNVHRDGTITDLKIVSPAAEKPFNTSALSALKRSNPTMDLPKDYPSDTAFFTVTFHYNEGIRH
jgi:TonB family protein